MNELPLTLEEGRQLRAPFPSEFIRRRQGRGAIQFAYITARDVMDRLDAVIEPLGWSTEFRLIDAASYAVECRLTIRGVTKADVGYPNNPEWDEDREPEKLKAAYSDAFKRAAVHWGIGRFLYGPSSVTQFTEDFEFSSDRDEDEERVVDTPVARPARAVAAPQRKTTLGGQAKEGVITREQFLAQRKTGGQ